MEALREALQDGDPRRIGPYTTLARLRATASAVQYVGRDEAAGGEPVVLSLAREELAALPAFRSRFSAEARTAEGLAGGWVTAPLDLSTDGSELWTAYAYVPAVTLSEAIALAGPLPERAVRTLGAGLAETLSRVHAAGTVLHGLAPATVLLVSDGPRLSAFGALGAAAHAEPAPGGGLSVRLGYLTPEQLAGEPPGTASDLFVLGLLLAYAATGTTPFPDGRAIAGAAPELDGVPDRLRDVVASCLAKSPADRPTAGGAAAALALEGAAALAKEGWLPEPVLTALSGQADAVARLARGDRAAVPRDASPVAQALSPGGTAGAEAPPQDADASGQTSATAVIREGGQATATAATDASGQTTATAPGDASGQATATAPGDASGQATATAPGDASGQATATAPGDASGQATATAPGDASGQATATAPGDASRTALPAQDATGQTTATAPGDATGQTTATAPGDATGQTTATAPGDASRTALPAQDAGGGRPAPLAAPSGDATGAGLPPQDAPGTGPEDGRGRDTPALSPADVRRVDRVTAALGIPRVRSAPEDATAGRARSAAPGVLPVGGSHAATIAPDAPPAHGAEPVTAAQGALPAAAPDPVPPAPEAPAGQAVRLTDTAPAAPDGGDAPKSALTASVLAAKAGAERRALVLGAAAGTVGLLVGGGVGAALAGGDEDETTPAAPPGPAPAAKPLPGVPPAPLWAYRHAGDGSAQATAWRDRVLVVSDDKGCTGVDLRTGRRLWNQPAAASAGHRPVVAGDGLFVIGATHFLWLSPQDGTVRHRIAAPAHVSAVTGTEGPVVWFTGTAGAGTFLVAYDAVARKELWRAQVPNGRARNAVPRYQGVAVRPDGLLVRQDGGSLTPQQQKANKGRGLFALYDRTGGKRLWGKHFGTVHQSAPVFGDAAGRLFALAGPDLHAYDTRSGRQLWRAAGAAGEGSVHGGTLFVPTAGHRLFALDAASGATRWTRSTEAGSGGGQPRVLLTTGGRTALVLESTQVTAFSTADGSRLWKFQDAGGPDPVTGYRGVVAGRTAVVWRGRAFYGLPLGR
ncbi:outer membrane protein assembly factor BamB family protein [Streptomyces marianii]|uniref:non-specific serine/threonine protein kinase n=1 Tax=Streptomyces marianii TaxID=1817406 RepID=A0A5R9E4L5_9ACTN|nr:PQQ-binding-like beta-propeller repeat protein [Streptomyces marianii]TLQ43802.1 serine/threonine protein kinase [Streptomyces marianii]